jgi:hypothetical protein
MTCAFRTRGIAFVLLAISSLIVDKTPGAVRCAGGRERPQDSLGRLTAPKSGVAPAPFGILSTASFVSSVFPRPLPSKASLRHRVKNLAVEKVQCVALTVFTRMEENPVGDGAPPEQVRVTPPSGAKHRTSVARHASPGRPRSTAAPASR